MAKNKTYAVEVEVVVCTTVYVEARRESTAMERAVSDEGWNESWRYDDADTARAVLDSGTRRAVSARVAW